MEEIVDSNQLHADKAFYNTLSRSQQISLTRRIEFEYEVMNLKGCVLLEYIENKRISIGSHYILTFQLITQIFPIFFYYSSLTRYNLETSLAKRPTKPARQLDGAIVWLGSSLQRVETWRGRGSSQVDGDAVSTLWRGIVFFDTSFY